MKDKFKRTLCGLLAPCIVLLSGCTNNELNKNDNSNNDIHSSEIDPSLKDETYDVVTFIAYDEINKIYRYYFTTKDMVSELPTEQNLDLACATFGIYVPLEVIEKSKIENYVGGFKGIVDPNVSVVNHTIIVTSEEGYECFSCMINILDLENNINMTQLTTSIILNDEIIFGNIVSITEDGEKILKNDKTSIVMANVDGALTYEEILELDNYYKKVNEDNKTQEENVLKRV